MISQDIKTRILHDFTYQVKRAMNVEIISLFRLHTYLLDAIYLPVPPLLQIDHTICLSVDSLYIKQDERRN